MLRLWTDWDHAWTELLGELLDGERDGFSAAAVALAEVGRVVVRADEFRGRDLSTLLPPKVPNLLVNCPPLPAHGDVLARLRAMASDEHFHTPAPTCAAGLIVAAADGTATDLLAQELAEVWASARHRAAFGWLAFIRDRLMPPPGPPTNGTYTRTEAAPAVPALDLHDLGRAEGLLPGLMGGNIEIEDEETAVSAGFDVDDTTEPAADAIPPVPLVPWNPGTFAARVRWLVAQLRAWHDDPFTRHFTTLAAGDSTVATKNRETFRDAARPFVGRPEPVHPPAEVEADGKDGRTAAHASALWLIAEVERQLAHAPHGPAWDYLRGLFEALLTRPAWTAINPPQDTAPLAFLAQQGRLVVVGRRVDDSLLLGLEDAATRLLPVNPAADSTAATHGAARAAGPKKKGRPPVPEDEARSNEELYLNWQAVHKSRGTSKEDYVRDMGLDRNEGLSAIEAGRYQFRKKRKGSGKKPPH